MNAAVNEKLEVQSAKLGAPALVMRSLRLKPADVARMLGCRPPGEGTGPTGAREVKRRALGAGPAGRLRQPLRARDRVVLEVLARGALSGAEVARRLGLKPGPVFFGHMAALVSVGWLVKSGRYKTSEYAITEAGRLKLSEGRFSDSR